MIMMDLGSKQATGFERTDVWDVRWSIDDPDLFVVLEKSKMVVFRGAEPEEPMQCSATVCEFKDLCIKCASPPLHVRLLPSALSLCLFGLFAFSKIAEWLLGRRAQVAFAFTAPRRHPSPFRAVHLDGIMRNPETPDKEFVEIFEVRRRLRQGKINPPSAGAGDQSGKASVSCAQALLFTCLVDALLRALSACPTVH